ncbi:MAG: DUF1302 family protein [Bradymonadaceae bacterium]
MSSRKYSFKIVITALFLFAFPAGASAETLEFSGSLSSSFGVFLFRCDPDCLYTDYENRNIFELALDADLGTSVAARAGVSLHNSNRPSVARAEDSAQIENLQDLSIRITDAWVMGYDLGVDGLDVRIGAQSVLWGTGDGFSPTNRLNPYDLSDPVHFDRRLATPAVLASYHISSFTVSGTWFPFFVPSLLSRRVIQGLLNADAADDIDLDTNLSGNTLEIDQVRTRVVLPDQTLSQSAFALRAAWAAPIADFAVGYYYGRDHLPQLSGEVIPENFFSGQTTDLIVNLRYPRLQMIAAEMRAPLFGSWTGWIDAALIIPSATRIFITRSRLQDLERLGAIDEAPDEDISAVIQTGQPYPNFLIGADTSIGTRVYLNFQYLHGFLFERNAAGLHHYGLIGLRAPAIEAPFEFELRGGVEANRPFDAFGFLTQLRFTYRHADMLELSALGTVQTGHGGTTLGLFTGLSEVRLTASAHF